MQTAKWLIPTLLIFLSQISMGLEQNPVISFHKAVDNEELSIISDLHQKNPQLLDSYHPDDGYTPLIRAARAGLIKSVEVLIKLGADILKPEQNGMKSLAAHKAAFMGYARVIEHLLLYPNQEDVLSMLETQGPKNGKTVLMDALWLDRSNQPPEFQIPRERIWEYEQIANILIAYSARLGADLTIVDHTGQSAMDYARNNVNRFGRFRSALYLLEAYQ